MTILAIDPGTHCGWAFRTIGGHLLSGTWDLRGGRFEGGGMRYVKLRRLLDEFRASQRPERVVFEEVRAHKGTDAAHVYGGIVAHITAWCEENDLPYCGCPVATIKKHATGKGNANKEAMLRTARESFGNDVGDDNEADALWLLSAAETGLV